MTVEDRDQWECLLADWSAAYDITQSDDEGDELPFNAVPHADRGALLEAARPPITHMKITLLAFPAYLCPSVNWQHIANY